MPEYIERTEELVLAMNAGARAIENTRRYHGAVYTKDVFSEDTQEIPYLLAAKVLREASDAPSVDAVVVTRCKDCRYRGLICCPAMHETMGNGLVDYAVDNGYCWCGKPKEDTHADDHD